MAQVQCQLDGFGSPIARLDHTLLPNVAVSNRPATMLTTALGATVSPSLLSDVKIKLSKFGGVSAAIR